LTSGNTSRAQAAYRHNRSPAVAAGRPSSGPGFEGGWKMRALTRWNPFREMTRFDPFFDLAPMWNEWRFPMMTDVEPAPTIKMDVGEDDKVYTVKAEIPGVAKEDIAVSIEGNLVSITAEVKREKEDKEGEKVLRTERYYGTVARSFTLPMDVDMGASTATYEGGVLTLMLPKLAGTKSKMLDIH
jgi:HSP20 family protein